MKKIKKKIPIMFMAIVVVVGIVLYSICKSDNLQSVKEKKNRTLAMYIENEAGEYSLSNSNTFPTEGYILDHAECQNGGTVTQDATTKKISASFSTSDSCNLYFIKEKFPFLDTILTKVNDATITDYESGNKGEMYTFKHNDLTTTTETDGTTYTHSATQVSSWTEAERTDYRYIGANPNNWVKFNDEDWRIIGIFTVETAAGNKEQLIKIIRNESIGNIPWDDYTNGVNEWPTASLKTMLNGQYYNTANSFDYTFKTNSTTEKKVTIPKGLNSTAQSQIEEVKWYLGGSETFQNLGGPDYYNFERGEKTCVTEGNCSGKPISTNTIAKVGLMYPSDYAYTYALGVDNICYTNGYNCKSSASGTPTNGWLYNNAYQWMLSPCADYVNNVFIAYPSGYLNSSIVFIGDSVRPTVYLKSNIKIVSGNGTSSEDPYILG